MFYANFILAKKGPLAKIWLAAHYEKKLNRNQILETDIQSSVNDIISPKIPIALRTSGHLLLGVVRIYSKKTKILFDDTNESYIKLKHITHADTLDLPKEKLVVDAGSITLPELSENRLFLNLNLNWSGYCHDVGSDTWQLKETLRSANLESSIDFTSNNQREVMRGHETNSFIDSDHKFSKSNIDSLVVSKDKITINPNTDNFRKNFDHGDTMDNEMFMDGDGIVPGIEDLINNVGNIEYNEASITNNNNIIDDGLDIILKPFEFKKELNKLKKNKQLKLAIDDEKSIKSEVFKRYLTDTSDIIVKKIRFSSEVEYEFSSCYYIFQDVHYKLMSNMVLPNIDQPDVTQTDELKNVEEDNIYLDNTLIDKQSFDNDLTTFNKNVDNVDYGMRNEPSFIGNTRLSSSSLEISKHWSKTTTDVFNEIIDQSQNNSKLFFNKLTNTQSLKKHTSAAIFYSLLVLHKENRCKINQSTSFGEVYLLFN